jgi:DNA polymerase
MSQSSAPETQQDKLLQHKRIALARMGIPLFSTRDGHLASTLEHQHQDQLLTESDKISNLLAENVSIEEEAEIAQNLNSAASAEAAVATATVESKPTNPTTKLMEWQTLIGNIQSCTACPLHQTRQATVVGDGDLQADWMAIGEAPSAEEAKIGIPFADSNGALLNAMFQALGLSRGQKLYLTTILKSHTPNNRDPSPEEMDACQPFLEQQVRLVQPKVIIAIGRVAAHRLLGEELSGASLSDLRGKVHQVKIAGITLPLIVTYHPTYLMRSPSQKAKAWDDMRLAWQCYQKILQTA